MTHKKNDFKLEKWYLDCVTESGEVLIGYIGILKWKNFKVPYSSAIYLSKENRVLVSTRIIRPRWPTLNEGELIWEDKRFKISGHWERDSSPIEAVVHETKHGNLLWQCYQPRAKTRIAYKDSFLAGYGYAEKLQLTELPWNIDMQTLRWGRFSSNEHALVWIQLAGTETKQWLWHNGTAVADSLIYDNAVEIPEKNLVLMLDQAGIIESEQKIFNTVKKLIKHLPGFDKIVPAKFLHAAEIKWRSQGQLFIKNELKAVGWSIHELVDFS